MKVLIKDKVLYKVLYKDTIILITYLFVRSVITNLRYLTDHLESQFSKYLFKSNQVILTRKIKMNIEFKYKQLNLAYVYSSDIQKVFYNSSQTSVFLLFPKYLVFLFLNY